jgi:Cd2+/Zn2+-exporting ATPase
MKHYNIINMIDKKQYRDGCCADDHCSSPPARPADLAAPEVAADGIRTPLRILQMDCPVEETMIRNKLAGMPSVKSLDFNLMQRILTVVHTPDGLDPILEALRSLGFQPEVPDAAGRLAAPTKEPSKPWWPLALGGAAAIASEAVGWLGLPDLLAAALAIGALAICGLSTYKKGWVALRNGNLNINALMSIAVTGAMLLQQWPEAAMVMVLFTIAELIEAKSLGRARKAIAGLMQLTPETATVRQADGSWQKLEVNTVSVGDLVRVKPGERIGLDGTIVAGHSTVDQAPITGESLPVDKDEGDTVYAGTINGAGSVDYRVTAAANNTTLARIIHAVEEAQWAKAPIQRLVDRFARVYTPLVFAIAIAVAVAPPLLAGGRWHDWIYKSLVLLVIACPCALVISTPVSIVSALAAAARHGILIKGGVYLEEGRKLKWLAFDKTGTITHGRPAQTDFAVIAGMDSRRCHSLAASLADRSDHPVSQAIAKTAAGDGIEREEVEAFKALPGRGVQGRIGGKLYFFGNHRLVEELGRCSTGLEARLDVLERQGKTVAVLLDDCQVLALFAVADTVKDESRAAIVTLHKLGLKTVMLTGDNQHTAEAIAAQVGIDQVCGNLLPEDKMEAVAAYATEGMVGMVGDGINDAPALARAGIGFAMGAMGTDTAIETADVALMDDDLRKVATFVRLSRATHSILVQNITFALGIKTVFLALTLAGFGTMWMAVFADMGASLLVVGNGLRLLRK